MIFFLGQSVAGREDLLNPGAFFHWPLAYASRYDHKNAIYDFRKTTCRKNTPKCRSKMQVTVECDCCITSPPWDRT